MSRANYAKREGIHPEVSRMLESCNVTPTAFNVLRQMKPLRQEIVAEHMRASGEFSIDFVKGLLALTPLELLTPGLTQRLDRRVAARHPARVRTLGHRATALVRGLLRFREAYGKDVLTLTVYCKLVERLLANPRVERYLSERHAESLRTLRVTLLGANVQCTKQRRRAVSVERLRA